MRSIVVSAHNPMTGPRHLGHYVSTMIEWPRLQRDHELFIVIDDLIGAILYPNGRENLQQRSLAVAREFMESGIDFTENHLILTSMVPEVHELAALFGMAIDQHWSVKLYGQSFAGILTSYERHRLGLPRNASLAEIVYPQTHLASLCIGLGAELFQGGEEMRGYLDLMTVITEEFGEALPSKPPSLLTTKCTFLVGTDGRHMATENAIFLSCDEASLSKDLSRVTSTAVLHQWLMAIGREELAKQFVVEGKPPTREEINQVKDVLLGELAKFRNSKRENNELVTILETSAQQARLRIRETLISIKRSLKLPGYVQ